MVLDDDWNHPCEGALTTDECMDEGGDGSSGWSYGSCAAMGPSGETCQKKLLDGTQYVCASVKYSARCNCDERTLKEYGSCTYMK